MKTGILIFFLVCSSSLAHAKPVTPKDQPCQAEIKKIEKALGGTGLQTPLTADTYKKALSVLKKSFKNPSREELNTYSQDLKKHSKKAPRNIRKIRQNSCGEVRKNLTDSLLRFAKSEIQNSEIKTEIWAGLSDSFQSKKANTLATLKMDVVLFSDAIKLFKPEDKALRKELKMFENDLKALANSIEEQSKELELEEIKVYTAEHNKVFLEEDEGVKGLREIFNDIVKSTKID